MLIIIPIALVVLFALFAMVGGQFEKGLADMKKAAEAAADSQLMTSRT